MMTAGMPRESGTAPPTNRTNAAAAAAAAPAAAAASASTTAAAAAAALKDLPPLLHDVAHGATGLLCVVVRALHGLCAPRAGAPSRPLAGPQRHEQARQASDAAAVAVTCGA